MRNRWSLVIVALAIAGCDTAARDEDRTAAGDGPSVKSYTAADLPQVADPLPTFLDDGRFEVSPPQDWHVLSRERKYEARFTKHPDPNRLPRITISALPAVGGIDDVSEDNLAEFVEQMQLRADSVKSRRMLEPCRPVILGDIPWSRHVRYISASGPAAVQALETARGGRLYVIELIVQAKEDSDEAFAAAILTERDTAYAVAANWRFVGEASTAPAEGAPTGAPASAAIETTEENPPPPANDELKP
jgi:hypothetical protein